MSGFALCILITLTRVVPSCLVASTVNSMPPSYLPSTKKGNHANTSTFDALPHILVLGVVSFSLFH